MEVKMEKSKKHIKAFLSFDEEYKEFELLESEHGVPESDGGWRDLPNNLHRRQKHEGEEEVPKRVDDVYNRLSEQFNTDINKDVILRRFRTGSGHNMLVAYMNGMADDKKINEFVLKPLMLYEGKRNAPDELKNDVIEISEADEEKDFYKARMAMMDGIAVLFSDGCKSCLLLETHGYEKRSVEKCENENVVMGPKESFNESFRTNITLIRRIIHTDDLIVESRMSGGENNTRLAIIYRKGMTNEALLEEVKKRLDGISIDVPITSGVIEQLVEDRGLIPVPRTLSTERPDRACSHIMQGSVCLIIEGSPFAVIMPITLFSLMNSPEDVYLRPPLGTILRIVRYIGAAISVLMPGYFLALALYHQGMLTTEVLSTVIASRKMVFEPIAIEMILLLLIFQMIREAGLRVPGSIGQAIGIIGGLIMGQAAVTAHLASSVILIIVAASGLGNFCIPDYSTQVSASYIRMAVVIAAWLGGLLAITAVILFITASLSSTKSFGVPFLAPFAPKTYSKRPFVIRGRIGLHKRAEDYMNTADDRML